MRKRRRRERNFFKLWKIVVKVVAELAKIEKTVNQGKLEAKYAFGAGDKVDPKLSLEKAVLVATQLAGFGITLMTDGEAEEETQTIDEELQSVIAETEAEDAAVTVSESIPEVSLDELPENVQTDYQGYEDNGWKGNYKGQNSDDYHAGGIYRNDTDPKLPEKINGKTPDYHEFDTGKLQSTGDRSAERFVRDTKSGKVFYTDSHYNGQWKEINDDPKK